MNAEFIREVLAFERHLRVGSHVVVRFSCGHGIYTGTATVAKVEKKRFVVKLLYPVQFKDATAKWPEGFELNIPNFLHHQIAWSQFNRLEPVEGYKHAACRST
jgi:hypothetical protein